MAQDHPKRRLVAMVRPPEEIASMTREELDDFSHQLWEAHVKPALQAGKAAKPEPGQTNDGRAAAPARPRGDESTDDPVTRTAPEGG
jgi:hypothetical protein